MTERPGPIESLRILFGASRGYWLVNQINFGDGIAYFSMLALMTLFLQDDVGFSTSASTGAVSTFSALVTLSMALGAGWVSDRLGVRRALALAVTVILLGRIAFVGSPYAGGLAVATAWLSILVMAGGEGILQPALYSGVKEYTDARTATLGYAFIYSIMNVGILAGAIVSPLIREWSAARQGLDIHENPRAGISGEFWFIILITAAMLVVHLMFFTRRVELRDRVLDPRAEADPTPRSLKDKLKSLPILDLRFVFFIFVLLPVRTLFAHQFLTMPDYVTRAFPSAVASKWEWVNGLNPLVITIGVPLIAMLTLRRRVVDMMIAGTAVTAASTFLLVREPNVTLLLSYVIIFSIGEAMWSSRFLEYVADIAPAHRVGIYMGIASIPWFLAKATTGLYAGSMLDRFVPMDAPQNPQTMWLIYGIIACISPLGLILARRWLIRGVRNEGVG
jgi:dipeptide/tripeptide permease